MTAGETGTPSNQGEFQRLKTQRLSDSAVEQLVELIRGGRLGEGEKLPSERKMVSLLGVSRNSYREAIRVLETMGYLRVVSGVGSWVREKPAWAAANLGTGWLLTHERQVFDLLEVRDALDIKAVELATSRGTAAQHEEIRRQSDWVRRAAESADVDESLLADTAFHAAVAEASGNQVLIEALGSVYGSLLETRRAMIAIPGRLRRMAGEHRALAEAILSRDPDAAARTMAQHALRVEREVAVAIHGEEFLQ